MCFSKKSHGLSCVQKSGELKGNHGTQNVSKRHPQEIQEKFNLIYSHCFEGFLMQ